MVQYYYKILYVRQVLIMKWLNKDKFLWSAKGMILGFIIVVLLFGLLYKPLVDFLSHKLPQIDNNAMFFIYVIENLSFTFIILLTLIIFFIILGLRKTHISYYGMALIIANITFYILMISNYKFYNFYGFQGYRGLETLLLMIFIALLSLLWFITEELLEHSSKIITYSFLIFTFIISLLHFVPVITYTIIYML